MTADLLPCPFCGGSAERIDFGPGSGDNEGGSCIACTKCQSSGPVEFGYKENFVSNWNRRALSHAAGQECTLGVGDGSGQLFVHGSYDAIKLPCPFCGTANPRSYVQPDEHGRYSYGVQCVGSECSTCGPERGATAEAIAAWNRRTASPAEGRMGEMPSKLAADLQGIANGELPDGDGVDTSVSLWAERWLERLATSPADEAGKGEATQDFERGYVKGYMSALAAASAECRRLGEALDHGGNVYVRNAEAIRCAVAVAGLYVPGVRVEGFDPAWVAAALGWIASDESTNKLSRREAAEQARIISAMYRLPTATPPAQAEVRSED